MSNDELLAYLSEVAEEADGVIKSLNEIWEKIAELEDRLND